MLDKRKIRLMSKLAVYDAKYGRIDRKNGQFFKWDYIYFRNFWTRAGVFSGCLIITLFYIMNKILVEQTDILAIDYKLEATKIGFYTILALIVYTFIGTAVAKSQYKKSKERFEAYLMMLDKLDELSEKSKERNGDNVQEKPSRHNGYYREESAGSPVENQETDGQGEQEYYERLREYYRQKSAQQNAQSENNSQAAGYDSRAEYGGSAASKEREGRSRKIDALLKFREAGRRNGNTDR